MKKLLLTILLITSPALAYEDYMVISDDVVHTVNVLQKDILDVNVLFTIDNEKKIMILTPKNDGETRIYIDTINGRKTIDVKIGEDETDITVSDGLTCYELDTPPELMDIPLPPINEDSSEVLEEVE